MIKQIHNPKKCAKCRGMGVYFQGREVKTCLLCAQYYKEIGKDLHERNFQSRLSKIKRSQNKIILPNKILKKDNNGNSN